MITLSTSSTVWAAETSLSSDTSLSAEGYFVLTWTTEPDSQTSVLLQQSTSENFSSPLETTLAANGTITLTGFEDGTYYFRARQEGSGFSDTVVVEVAHHSLQRALSFFLVGFILFIILATTIFMGNRNLIDEHSGEAKDAR